MSAVETNWQSFLAPDSDLPPDVFFLVNDEESRGGSPTIGAHKLILAGVSPVFRGMFYGPLKETREVIEVRETTYEAFDTLVKYIYHPPGGPPFNLNQINCPQKLFELLTLATKYQMLKLATLTSDALESLTLNRENMIFTATVAKNYKEVFCDLSTKMTMKCLKFLIETTSSGGDVCALIKETAENFPAANLDILRELIDVGGAILQLPGWDGLIFFDINEHQIGDKVCCFQMPKLGDQWKIFFDFKPTEYIQDERLRTCVFLALPHNDRRANCLGLAIRGSSKIFLHCGILHFGGVLDGEKEVAFESNELPVIDKWTRVEISHEKENDKYFLYLTVGGKELGRKDVTSEELRGAPDTLLCIGENDPGLIQPGFIRRLVALKK